MLPNKRAVQNFTFLENRVTQVKLPKGFLEEGLVITGDYDDTITTIATSVRTYGCPIRVIRLVGDGGKVIHSATPADLIAEALVYEAAGLADMVSPPAAVAVGVQPGRFAIPLMFAEPFSGKDRLRTALATWAYDELTLEIEWGSHAEIYVGGVGSITRMNLSLTAEGAEADYSGMGNPFEWAGRLHRMLRGYKTVAIAGAAVGTPIELLRTADVRSIFIWTLDANGVPVDTMLDKITLQLNDSRNLFTAVAARAIKSSNSKLYGLGVPMPTGLYILEFAEDQDIFDVLPARGLTSLNLFVDTLAVAGSIRVFQRRIESAAA